MKHRRLVYIMSAALAMFIIAPRTALAEEDTPADAPYQETIDEAVDTVIEPLDPIIEEASPTLPSVHNSPMTVNDPTLAPSVEDSSTSKNTVQTVPASVSSQTTVVKPKKRYVSPVALTASLTPRAIQTSRVWSQPSTAVSLKTTMYARTSLTKDQTSDLQRNGLLGIAAGLGLATIGGATALYSRKRHA